MAIDQHHLRRMSRLRFVACQTHSLHQPTKQAITIRLLYLGSDVEGVLASARWSTRPNNVSLLGFLCYIHTHTLSDDLSFEYSSLFSIGMQYVPYPVPTVIFFKLVLSIFFCITARCLQSQSGVTLTGRNDTHHLLTVPPSINGARYHVHVGMCKRNLCADSIVDILYVICVASGGVPAVATTCDVLRSTRRVTSVDIE